MTLREEILKQAGILSEARNRITPEFKNRVNLFSKELSDICRKYNVKLEFGYIDSGDDDQIIIQDNHNEKFATYLETEPTVLPKMSYKEKLEYKQFLKRAYAFIVELHTIEDKHNVEYGVGWVDAGDDDDFIVFDKNSNMKMYI